MRKWAAFQLKKAFIEKGTIFVNFYVTDFNRAFDSLRTQKGDVFSHFSKFMKNPAEATTMSQFRMFGNASYEHEGTSVTYKLVVKHVQRRYGTNALIVKSDEDMRSFKQIFSCSRISSKDFGICRLDGNESVINRRSVDSSLRLLTILTARPYFNGRQLAKRPRRSASRKNQNFLRLTEWKKNSKKWKTVKSSCWENAEKSKYQERSTWLHDDSRWCYPSKHVIMPVRRQNCG